MQCWIKYLEMRVLLWKVEVCARNVCQLGYL